ncbi:MAG TPA: response regulator [Acidimicrobiales bacterium]|nr:response regulator [Acidimicrobiales bacterium]HUB71775.1 response regulator [Acidimicrobiales bacterium]
MRTLLIVDDEDGVRTLVRMTLDSARYEIIEAADGRRALELAREHRPDLVLLDVMLPDMSGLEVCRQLKSQPELGSTTVIMLTARAQSSDVGDAEEAGANGYFTKPFSPLALTRKVEDVLGAVL